MLKRKELNEIEKKVFCNWFGDEKKVILENVYSKISDNLVEVLEDIEEDIYGFDRWKDWRLSLGNIKNIFSFCKEIEVWNDINSDFGGEYDSLMFRECYEDYINWLNEYIEDKEFKEEVINCFNWYFSEWIED
jgi:accessory colonization factor AcfC